MKRKIKNLASLFTNEILDIKSGYLNIKGGANLTTKEQELLVNGAGCESTNINCPCDPPDSNRLKACTNTTVCFS